MDNESVIIIGYSGHGFVICDIFNSQKIQIVGYCEKIQKKFNPYNLTFFGQEVSKIALEKIVGNDYFVGVGNNQFRRKITNKVISLVDKKPINAIHNKASISSTASLQKGIMVGNGSIINACSQIGNGVICNTQSVIEHECILGDYCHIAPGAVLCGNVKVGENTFIGAKSVVKQGVTIGENVIVGAGTVVLKDLPDNVKVVGNPQKNI